MVYHFNFMQHFRIITALQDYEQAIKIDPNNESLVQDAKMIRKIIQGSNSGDEDTVE